MIFGLIAINCKVCFQGAKFPKGGTEPQTFIIHCGTNDIEKLPTDNISNEMKSLLSSIKLNHPESRIILSCLPPRNDNLLQKAQNLNDKLMKIAKEFPNTTAVTHENLYQSTAILYDRKHLNNKGFKGLAKNLKSAYFGTHQKSANLKRKLYPHPASRPYPQQATTLYPPPLPFSTANQPFRNPSASNYHQQPPPTSK